MFHSIRFRQISGPTQGANVKFRPVACLVVTASMLTVGFVPLSAAASASGQAIPLLTIGGVGGVTTLDMTKTDANGDIDDLTLDSLLKLGPNGQIEPYLATSSAQPNPVTYVYHLRHGVKFWDGTELTAADAVYSLNTERAPGSVAALGFSSVKSVGRVRDRPGE
jgi:peptide/nickel transport system substrate-binding protein